MPKGCSYILLYRLPIPSGHSKAARIKCSSGSVQQLRDRYYATCVMAHAPLQARPWLPRRAPKRPTFTQEATKLTARRDETIVVLLQTSFHYVLHFSQSPYLESFTLSTHADPPPHTTQTDSMATFFDGVKKSWQDVPVDASKDNAISTTEFLEAAESLTTLFGTSLSVQLAMTTLTDMRQIS